MTTSALLAIALPLAVLLAFAVVNLRARRDSRDDSYAPMPGVNDSAELDAAVRKLTNDGRRIRAVKLVRQRTGLSLTRAKYVVDQVAAGYPMPDLAGRPRPPHSSTSYRPAPAQTHPVGDETMRRVHELLAQGRKIQAVKELRQRTGLSLAAAKNVVDRL